MGSFPDCTSLDWKPVVRLARRSSSTALDYFAFTRLLLAGGTIDSVRIFKPETVKLMARLVHRDFNEPTPSRYWTHLITLETPSPDEVTHRVYPAKSSRIFAAISDRRARRRFRRDRVDRFRLAVRCGRYVTFTGGRPLQDHCCARPPSCTQVEQGLTPQRPPGKHAASAYNRQRFQRLGSHPRESRCAARDQPIIEILPFETGANKYLRSRRDKPGLTSRSCRADAN